MDGAVEFVHFHGLVFFVNFTAVPISAVHAVGKDLLSVEFGIIAVQFKNNIQGLDGQGAFDELEVGEIVRDILAVRIFYHRLTPAGHLVPVLIDKGVGHVVEMVGIGSGVGHCEGAAGRADEGKAVRQALSRHGSGSQRRSVIGFFGRSGGKGDLGAVFGDFQGSDGLGNSVVAALGSAPVDGIAALGSADFGDGAGRSDFDGFLVRIRNAGDGNCSVQRLSVVLFGGGFCRDGDSSGIDRQRAFYCLDVGKTCCDIISVRIEDLVGIHSCLAAARVGL